VHRHLPAGGSEFQGDAAAEPAPNSQTSWVPVCRKASSTCTARTCPKRGLISGAVAKSLPEPGMVPNLREVLA